MVMNRIRRFVAALVACLSAQAVAGDAQYKVYGLDFSPYEDGQSPDWRTPVSLAQLRERMAIIQPYTRWVRSFGSADGLEFSGAVARELGLKAALGAWISSDLSANEAQLANLIAAAQRGEADMLVVGSEVMRRRELSEGQLIDYIRRVRQAVPASVLVTTADVYGEILGRPALRAACDLLFVNYYPYWEGIGIARALAVLEARHRDLVAAADGKRVVVSETGWPSDGDPVGEAVPTEENARRYFVDFARWADKNAVDYFYFSALDETWKVAQEGPQGGHWGLWDKDGRLKPGREAVFSGRECLFDWAEAHYASLFAPAGRSSSAWSVYHYRYYPETGAYLGVSSEDGDVYYLGPDGHLTDVGPLPSWLPLAGCQRL
jgi:exo-beta-1,3-glucanase (GH17 family)